MFNIDNAIVNFGKRIQEARQLRNITQDQLAEKCNVTPKHISAIERGTTTGSITLLLNICYFLEIISKYIIFRFLFNRKQWKR